MPLAHLSIDLTYGRLPPGINLNVPTIISYVILTAQPETRGRISIETRKNFKLFWSSLWHIRYLLFAHYTYLSLSRHPEQSWLNKCKAFSPPQQFSRLCRLNWQSWPRHPLILLLRLQQKISSHPLQRLLSKSLRLSTSKILTRE